MLCCRAPGSSKRDIEELIGLCGRLFVVYRVNRGPESMAEFRAQLKWVMREALLINHRADGDLRGDLFDALDEIGNLVVMRGLWLYIEPTVMMETWAQFQLAVDVSSNWYNCYQPDVKESIDSFMEWVDNNTKAIYELPPTDYNAWDYPVIGEDDDDDDD
ncbi:hypothetical protein Ciccas_012381 [Cichlidogyrus casuarinus]|uniref:Uncharacterized protein n=1 Tax=Cichlidogyrus casuarinus TaxID=1844966 RepID=A0ABD2PNK8_9PLAT